MRPRPDPRLFLGLALLFAGLGPCVAAAQPATPQPAAEAGAVDDRWEHSNRQTFAVHQAIDHAILRPIALLYKALTPGPIGKGIHNFLSNLDEPWVFANDVVQLRFKRAGRTLLRFTANTTAGWGGLMDVASRANLPHHDNGFGVTLARYGVGPGPYMFIPLVGPATVRDLIGQMVDAGVDPINYIRFPHRPQVVLWLAVAGGLDARASAEDELNTLFAGSADPYATLRSSYMQYQAGLLHDDDASAVPALPDFDSSPTSGPTAAPDAATAAPPTIDAPAASGTPPPATSAPAPGPAAAADTPDDGPMASAGADARPGAAPIVEASL